MADTFDASTIAARLGLDLPAISGPLTIRFVEDRVDDGFGLIRTDASPPAEVAVIYDGSDQGVGDASHYGRLVKLAPVMLMLLAEALGTWERQFDGSGGEDECVPGSDVVEWFAWWRRHVRSELAAAAKLP